MPNFINRQLGTALCLALALQLPAHAIIKGNAASMALIEEGNTLSSQGQYQQAVDKFSAAAKADPAASLPLSMIAGLISNLAQKSTGDARAKLRQQAEGAARSALRLDGQDPIAQEILRQLLDDTPPPSTHAAPADAVAAFNEGETLFQRSDLVGALKQYELALQRDPLFARAWLTAGDCYYVQKNWPEAESRFRKAVELEPLDAQAWRFLSDALASQGKIDDADQALVRGIAAQPSQLPNWDKLSNLRARVGHPLKPLKLVPKGGVRREASGDKWAVLFDPSSGPDDHGADNAIWLSLNLATATGREKNLSATPALSAYQLDLQAWRTALQVAGELADAKGESASDPALRTMLTLAKSRQLEAALFLLLYKESYRTDFEDWKRANPNGISAFLATTSLRP